MPQTSFYALQGHSPLFVVILIEISFAAAYIQYTVLPNIDRYTIQYRVLEYTSEFSGLC